jgi:hypothetical protein
VQKEGTENTNYISVGEGFNFFFERKKKLYIYVCVWLEPVDFSDLNALIFLYGGSTAVRKMEFLRRRSS